MISMGDHERLPDDNSLQNSRVDLTEEQKKRKFDKKYVNKLRKGLNLKHTSRVVDKLVGMTMQDYVDNLKERSKGYTNEHKNEHSKQLNNPIKSNNISKRNLTLPNRNVSNKHKLRNKPINTKDGNDMLKVLNLASANKSGFRMSNKLRNKLRKR